MEDDALFRALKARYAELAKRLHPDRTAAVSPPNRLFSTVVKGDRSTAGDGASVMTMMNEDKKLKALNDRAHKIVEAAYLGFGMFGGALDKAPSPNNMDDWVVASTALETICSSILHPLSDEHFERRIDCLRNKRREIKREERNGRRSTLTVVK